MDVVKKSLPMKLLQQIKDSYPGVFEQLDIFRYDETMNDLWPHGQIFVPVVGVTALFRNREGIPSVELYQDMETTAALVGWRQQKNIYAFTAGTAAAVYAAELGNTMVDALKLLAWSMYIQPQSGEMMPGVGNQLDGFFAYWDLDKDVYELRFLPISTVGQQFPPIVLSIPRDGKESIATAIEKSLAQADDVYAPTFLRQYLTHWTQLVLFLGSTKAQITLNEEHVYKAAKKTLHDTPQEVAYYTVTSK